MIPSSDRPELFSPRKTCGPVCCFVLVVIAVGVTFGSQVPDVEEPLGDNDVAQLLQIRGSELTDQDLKRICTNSDLRELDLSGCNRLTNAGFTSFSKLERLESLNLSGCHRLSGTVFEEMAGIQTLRRLDISSTKFNVREVAEYLKKIPNLEWLVLRGGATAKTLGLGELTGLTHLDISGGKITDADLAPLATLTKLKYLNANGSRNYHSNGGLSNKGLKHLEELKSLEFLGLFGHHKLNAKGYNPLFSKLSRLKKLEMGFNWPLKGKDVEIPTSVVDLDLMESFQLQDAAVINLKNKRGLRTLNLFYCLELTDKSLEALQDLPQLESLNLGCIKGLTNEGLRSLEGSTGLTYLNLGDNDNFSDVGLGSLEKMVALEELNLWSVPNLKGQGLKVLDSMPQLRTLNLADCSNLTDEAIQHVSRSTNLVNLYLDNCTEVSDEGISRLARLSNLQELTLDGCLGITDQSLLSLGKLRSLQYLVLSHCPGLTSQGMRDLGKALPDCEIVRD